jgi:hypothetical protein
MKNSIAMLDEPALANALARLGYLRLKKHVYRAEWSTDVEHFIYFQYYGTPKAFLAADFGMRTIASESFAFRTIQQYGGGFYRRFPDRGDERCDCCMRFSLGLLGSWGMRSSLIVPDMTGLELAQRVQADVEQKLFPIIRGVTSLDRLFSLLQTDQEPHPWLRCNGAMRAAMIANLGQRIGLQGAQVHDYLTPRMKHISHHLTEEAEGDPLAYVESTIADAFSRSDNAN